MNLTASKLAAVAMMAGALSFTTGAMAATVTVFSGDEAGWKTMVGNTRPTESFDSSSLIPWLSVVSTVGTVFRDANNSYWSDSLVRGQQTTTWTFQSQTTAFGGNWNLAPGNTSTSATGSGIAITMIFGNGGRQPLFFEVPATFMGQFFGFVSSEPFTSVLLTAGSQGGSRESYRLDNIIFATPASVVAPGPVAGAGLPLVSALAGFAGFSAFRRRRNAAAG